MKRRPEKNVRHERGERERLWQLPEGRTFFAISEDTQGLKDEAGKGTTRDKWMSGYLCDLQCSPQWKRVEIRGLQYDSDGRSTLSL